MEGHFLEKNTVCQAKFKMSVKTVSVCVCVRACVRAFVPVSLCVHARACVCVCGAVYLPEINRAETNLANTNTQLVAISSCR